MRVQVWPCVCRLEGLLVTSPEVHKFALSSCVSAASSLFYHFNPFDTNTRRSQDVSSSRRSLPLSHYESFPTCSLQLRCFRQHASKQEAPSPHFEIFPEPPFPTRSDLLAFGPKSPDPRPAGLPTEPRLAIRRHPRPPLARGRVLPPPPGANSPPPLPPASSLNRVPELTRLLFRTRAGEGRERGTRACAQRVYYNI